MERHSLAYVGVDIAKATLRLIAEPKNPDDPRYRKHFLQFYWGKKPAHIR